MLIPKTKTVRDSRHLDFIRELPCCVCGKSSGKSQAAHVRLGNGGGMGMKPGDDFTIPMCAACHHSQHQKGERAFWGDVRKPSELANALFFHTGDVGLALERIVRFRRDIRYR